VLCLIRSDFSRDFLNGLLIENSKAKSGPSVGGKPPLGPKSKDYAKVTATHSEPHFPVAEHHREPQPFPIHKPFLDSKVLSLRFLLSGVGSYFSIIRLPGFFVH